MNVVYGSGGHNPSILVISRASQLRLRREGYSALQLILAVFGSLSTAPVTHGETGKVSDSFT